MKTFRYVVWFKVSLPEPGSKEHDRMLRAFLAEDPEYGKDPENLEPQVIEGNLVAWLPLSTYDKKWDYVEWSNDSQWELGP